jgi:hypothetical protein
MMTHLSLLALGGIGLVWGTIARKYFDRKVMPTYHVYITKNWWNFFSSNTYHVSFDSSGGPTSRIDPVVFFRDGNPFYLPIQQAYGLAQFLDKHNNSTVCCYNFVQYVCTCEIDPQLSRWKRTKCIPSKIGQAVVFSSRNDDQHAAIYLGNDMYLSKLGFGPVDVQTMDELKQMYSCDVVCCVDVL